MNHNVLPPAPTRRVLALAADLLFAGRIRGTAALLGVEVELANRPEDLVRRAEGAPPRLVLIDLDARGLDIAAVVGALHSQPGMAGVPIIAFVAHVRADAIEAARQAGVDRVLARSAFVSALPELLQPAV